MSSARTFGVVAVLFSGCIVQPATESGGGGLVNGTLTDEHSAVGLLRFAARGGGREAGWRCTASLIADNVIVTAAHCFGIPPTIGRPELVAKPVFGIGPSGMDETSRVVWNELSGVNDVAVAVLDRRYAGLWPLATGGIGANSLEPPEDRRIFMIGYGETSLGAHDYARRGGWSAIWRVDASTFTSYAGGIPDGVTDGCHGDSGGPALPYDPDFIGPVLPTVIGVISRSSDGSADCGVGTVFARLDATQSTIDHGRDAGARGATGSLRFTAGASGMVVVGCEGEDCFPVDDAGDAYDDGSNDGSEPAGEDGSAGFDPGCSCDLDDACNPDEWDGSLPCGCDRDCG